MPQPSPTSAFVRSSLSDIGKLGGLALDIPCGSGRHSVLLASLGFSVVAADIDMSKLLAARAATIVSRTLSLIQLNATSAMPFIAGAFSLVVIVHPPYLNVLFNAVSAAKSGGHVIFESFGSQGENWRLLPRPREVADFMAVNFDTLKYIEKPARHTPAAVTVKGLFKRR